MDDGDRQDKKEPGSYHRHPLFPGLYLVIKTENLITGIMSMGRIKCHVLIPFIPVIPVYILEVLYSHRSPGFLFQAVIESPIFQFRVPKIYQ